MILRRYMISQTAITTLVVLGFLVVMLLGGRLIRYFGIAAEGGLDVGVLLTLIGYNLPYFLELILPLSFFIGLMLVFGRMYVDHEMAVLFGSGIGRSALTKLLLPLAIVMFLLQSSISLLAKPWGVAKASTLWQEQSVVELFEMIRPKQFISSGEYHLYVGEVGENREFLKDVIVVDMSKRNSNTDKSQSSVAIDTSKIPQKFVSNKDTLIFAKSATQVESNDGVIRLDLYQGRRYEFDVQQRHYNQVKFERYRISLARNSASEGKPIKIEGVPTWQLLQMANSSHAWAKAELAYRLSLPWLIVLALLLATPLSAVKPRQGRWIKLIPAILIFVANVLILISLKEMVGKDKISVAIYPMAVIGLMMVAVYLNYHESLWVNMRLKRVTLE